MKSIFVLALGFLAAPFVAAQDITSIPQCALNCALGAISGTGCSVSNATCICEAQSFQQSVATCIQGACNATDIQATLQFAQQYCAAAGVTLSAASMAATSASSAAASTISVMATSLASAASSAMASASARASSMASAASSSAAAATYTGAAAPAQNDGAWGGVVMGFVGLVAAVL